MKNKLKVKVSLFLNYFVFAILLNSVGIVILQVINHYGVSHEAASALEGFKDFSIAIFSFLIASYLPRFGYKKSMLGGLLFVTLGCVMMRFLGSFWMSKLLFAMVGVSFAVIKVSAYSTVGLITEDSDDHASVMSMLEGYFMVGVLLNYWLFGFFIDMAKTNSSVSWLDTYWVLAVICIAAFILLYTTELDESEVKPENPDTKKDFLEMIGLVRFPLVLLFILGSFLYVAIEQGLGTWLPTFNNEILHLPDSMSVQVTSIFAGGLAVGRLGSGYVMKYVHWFYVLIVSLICSMILVLLVLPLTHGIEPGSTTNWFNAPLAAYILPMIGFFLAPIYPTLSSTILSKLPKPRQSAMTGLIVIFSALGGTTGSIITGFVFGRINGIYAFYLLLIPMAALLILLFPYRKIRDQFEFDTLTEQTAEETN